MSLLEFCTEWNGKLVSSLRKRGLSGTVQFAARVAKGSWRSYWEKRFDRQFGVNTVGIIRPSDLPSDSRFRYSNGYGPSSSHDFFRMLRQIDADYSKFLFIDFGCGKGKALLLAAGLPFKHILGVELMPELARIAEENLGSYRGKRKCNRFQLHCMDASEFPIPGEPSIYYFYDPFLEEVMGKVLENIQRSLVAAPREAYVVFYDEYEPERRDLLDKSGFLMPVKKTRSYAIYQATGVPALRDKRNV